METERTITYRAGNRRCALQFLGVPLRRRTYLRDVRVRMRADLGSRGLTIGERLLSILAGEASGLLRKTAQFTLEMLPQRRCRAVECRADPFVEGQDG